MALTGLGLIGFVVAHLSGNLLIYAGPDAINSYAEGLRKFPAVLWGLRFGLIGMFLIHVPLAIKLVRENRAARPIAYAYESTVKATWASRYMALTGITLLFFVIYHLAHFTWRVTSPEIAALGHFECYKMLVMEFNKPHLAGLYIIAMLGLWKHLWHGVTSLFQTLGFHHKRYWGLIRLLGPVVGTVLAVGNISIPLAVLLGVIK
jgi:succinate dehydrogenase / fumarate reductase cytochrome b subunit